MTNAAVGFLMAYCAIGAIAALIVKTTVDLDDSPGLDWFSVTLAWPILMIVVGLTLLLGVVLPLWDEIDFWSLLRRS